jgi:hypothetical protein
MVSLFIAANNLSVQTLEANYKFDNGITDETGNWNLTATDENSSITYRNGSRKNCKWSNNGF